LKKKNFVEGLGFSGGDATSGGGFAVIFVQLYPVPIQWASWLPQSFLETRLPSESLEPLVVFLAYLEPKLWPPKQKVVKISTPQTLRGALHPDYIWP